MTRSLSIPRIILWDNLSELPHLEEVDLLANLTELLDPSLLDFTSSSFIGRSVRSFGGLDNLHF